MGDTLRQEEEVNIPWISLPNSMGNQYLTQYSLTVLFEENPEIGVGLYNFMKRNSKNTKYIEYDIFEAAAEVLLKEPMDQQYRDYKNLEKLDILALLIASKKDGGKEELKTLMATYDNACNFVKIILRIFQTGNKTIVPPDTVAIRSIVDGIFTPPIGKSDGTIIPSPDVPWQVFLTHIKTQLNLVNAALKSYFATKLLNKTFTVKLPEFSRPSVILNNESLALLYLSNSDMQSANKLELLYTSKQSEYSFEQLAGALSINHKQNYSGSTLILAKVSPHELTYQSREYEVMYVVGGFSKTSWKDGGVYHGDYFTYVFSNYPKFRNFHSLQSQSSLPNFQYLNTTSTGNRGIGFGGSHKNDFRLWLDGGDGANSFVSKSDSTFESGEILDEKHSTFRIDIVEVWGLGTSLTSPNDNLMRSQFTQLKFYSIVQRFKDPITVQSQRSVFHQ